MKVPTIRIADLIACYAGQLQKLYDPREALNIIREVVNHFIGIDRLSLALNLDTCVSESEMILINNAVKALLEGRPLQYVTGLAWFDGRPFVVNENVLIPRQETEGLLKIASGFIAENPVSRLLDACTGSGCIAIGIKLRHPGIDVVGTDFSEKAIEVAKVNAHKLDAQIALFKEDLLSGHQNSGAPYSLILSNPPYIPECERYSLSAHVLAEPESALFVPDNNPLIFYKELADIAFLQLAPGGMLAVECHTSQTGNVAQLFSSHGLTGITLLDDYHGRSRFVTARKN